MDNISEIGCSLGCPKAKQDRNIRCFVNNKTMKEIATTKGGKEEGD